MQIQTIWHPCCLLNTIHCFVHCETFGGCWEVVRRLKSFVFPPRNIDGVGWCGWRRRRHNLVAAVVFRAELHRFRFEITVAALLIREIELHARHFLVSRAIRLEATQLVVVEHRIDGRRGFMFGSWWAGVRRASVARYRVWAALTL